jgi:hypothetical protein
VYEVIADPPLFVGAVNETVAWPSSIVAVGEVGAPGFVAGVIGPASVAGEVPDEFSATIENLYGVPLVSPATVHEVAGVMTWQVPTVVPVAESIAVTV